MLYQIFPESFAIGKPYDITAKLALPAYQRADYVRHQSWDETPTGEKDFFGGDLNGIIDNLDYIKDLGATGIYLTPVFSARTNHKYNTHDFNTIDPMFGDKQALITLIEGTHDRGIRLTMDAVLNHVGKDSEWFARALRNEHPYKDFFTFLPNGTYQCWWGFDNLPELRLEHPLLRRLLWGDESSILQSWLSLGLDDWRFDAALDLGLDVAEAISASSWRALPPCASHR